MKVMKKLFLALAVPILTATVAHGDETRFQKLDRIYGSDDRRYAFVIAHRGLPDAEAGIPENSVASITNAIAHGADMIEVDLKITSDRRIILMHDSYPNAVVFGSQGYGSVGLGPTASWQGQLEKCILKKARTRNEPSGEHICLLEDALEAARDQAFFCFDVNIWQTSDNLDVIYGIIERKHMERQCLFPSGLNGGQLRNVPRWVRYFDKSGRILSMTLDQNTPDDFNDSSALKDERFGWTRRLDEGATLIMTDRPAELVTYLERHGRRELVPERDTRRMVKPLIPTNVAVTAGAVCQGAVNTADYRVVSDERSAQPGVRSVTLALKDPKKTRWTDTTDGEKRVWYRAVDSLLLPKP